MCEMLHLIFFESSTLIGFLLMSCLMTVFLVSLHTFLLSVVFFR